MIIGDGLKSVISKQKARLKNIERMMGLIIEDGWNIIEEIVLIYIIVLSLT